MTERITSKENPKIKEALKAASAKDDLFLAEGYHLVEMALEAGYVVRLFSVKPYSYPGVETILINDALLHRLAFSKNPEGIVALCHKPSPKKPQGDVVLYLDRVQDPGNVGTLLRSALAFCCHDIVLSKGTAEVFAPKTIMASQGAVFRLNLYESKADPVEDIQQLKNDGYYLLGTDLKSSLPLKELSVPRKFVLILGNEGQGVDSDVLALTDARVRIEMSGIDSLNVGVAGGILLYELCQTRHDS